MGDKQQFPHTLLQLRAEKAVPQTSAARATLLSS